METRFSSLLAQTKAEFTAQPEGIPTGYPSLDAVLKGGLRPGQMGLVLARTEVGKTAWSLNVAVNAALAGYGVAVASLEQTAAEITVRALSILSGQPADDVVEAVKSKQPEPLVLEGVQKLKDFHVRDKPQPQWSDLAVWLAEIKGRTGVATKLLVLDHLQLMGKYGYPKGQVERVQALAADSKVFAKETGCAVLVLHQVGRAQEGDATAKNHGASALSLESGMYGAEQDADVAFGLYRPERDPSLTPQQRLKVRDKLVVQILKNRHGPNLLDGVELRWQKPSLRIVEETPQAAGLLKGEMLNGPVGTEVGQRNVGQPVAG